MPKLQVFEVIDLQFIKGQSSARLLGRISNLEDDLITVSIVSKQKKSDVLSPGQALLARALRPDASYNFEARVEKVNEVDVSLITLKRTSDITRVQQREFCRADVEGRIRFQRLGYSGDSKVPWSEGGLINLSSGGGLMESTKKLEPEDLIQIKLNVEDFRELEFLLCVVKRVEETKFFKKDEPLIQQGFAFLSEETYNAVYKDKLQEAPPKNVQFMTPDMQKDILQFVYQKMIQVWKKV